MDDGRRLWAPAAILMLFVVLLAVPAAAGNGACLPALLREPVLKLSGDIDPMYSGESVYRRFGTLAATAKTNVWGGGGPLQIRIRSASGAWELLRADGEAGRHTLTASLQLQSPDGPLPAGRYVVQASAAGSPGCAPAVREQQFYVVFNPFDVSDEVYQVPPDTRDRERVANLGDQVTVLAGGDEYLWSLGTYTKEVFRRAIEAVEGHTSAQAAAEALRELAHREVEGYWPGLTDTRGRVSSSAPPEDLAWINPWREAVAGNLGKEDVRGQCFDFAAVLTALSRSVGIPATVVTAMEPASMPYPYEPEWEINWSYHVWTEVFADGTWWATDASYPADFGYVGPYAAGPGPQPRSGPWFQAVSGSDGARIVGEFGGVRTDVTDAYRSQTS